MKIVKLFRDLNKIDEYRRMCAVFRANEWDCYKMVGDDGK